MNKKLGYVLVGLISAAVSVVVIQNNNNREVVVDNKSIVIKKDEKQKENQFIESKTMTKVESKKENPALKEKQDKKQNPKEFDFEDKVPEAMKSEIYELTRKDTDGLEIEVNEDGKSFVNLKKRFSHVHISIVDENGEKVTGEYAPKQKTP